MNLRVHSIETFGTTEGPGIRLVVFLQGCNFACLYCHNADTQEINGGRIMNTDEIMKLLEKQKPYFRSVGGLSVSGGEPLLQAKGLVELFKKAHEAGISTVLTTNGSILTDTVKELLSYTDLVIMDIKQINNEKHIQLTGRPNRTPLAFAKYLQEIDKPLWLRYVIIPGYTDDHSDLVSWCEHFRDYKNIQQVILIPYHTLGVYKYRLLGRDYTLNDLASPTKEEVTDLKSLFNQYFHQVTIS